LILNPYKGCGLTFLSFERTLESLGSSKLLTEKDLLLSCVMRKIALALLMISALIFSSMPVSQAGLNAQVNLDNPRVVPIFGQDGASEVRLMVMSVVLVMVCNYGNVIGFSHARK